MKHVSLRSVSSTSTSKPDAFVYFVQPGAADTNLEAQRLWTASRTTNSTKALDARQVFEDNAVKSIISLGDASSWAKKSGDSRREVIRKAAGTGVGKLREVALSADVKTIQVDATGDASDVHAAAVGAKLGLHSFTLKTGKTSNPTKGVLSVEILCYGKALNQDLARHRSNSIAW